MKQGTYRLERTVDNPQPGRRKSDWTAWPSWQKGMVFVVKEETVDMPEGYEDRKVLRLTRPTAICSLSLTDARAVALAAHLVQMEEKPSEWLSRMDRGTNMASDVIDHLVASGTLSRGDIEAAYEHCLAALFEQEDE